MAGRQRTSFEKRERERKRQEKQAAKRARRQHDGVPSPEETRGTTVPPEAPPATEPERLDTAEG
jgi:hypothetical protein